MKILAIECTHQFAGVAASNGKTVVEKGGVAWQKTAEAIVPLVMQAMKGAGLAPGDLDAVAVSAGPGSFTALRIGMSVAKGIAYGAGCPLVPVSTTLAMASAALGRTDAPHIVPIIPSRPGEWFYAIFRRNRSGGLDELEQGRCMATELSSRIASLEGGVSIPARVSSVPADQLPELRGSLLEASFFTAASLLPLALQGLAAPGSSALSEASPDYRQIFVPLRKKQ